MTQEPIPDPIMDAAIAWSVRVGDPAFADWDGFALWMEADPRHAEAYHAVSADEAEMVDLLATAPPQKIEALPVRAVPRRRWAIPVAAALAASVIGVVGYRTQMQDAAPLVYQTAPGKRLEVALKDGSRVVLNGDTRLEADRDDPRSLALIRGEALFTVRHDEAHPFTVAVGGVDVVDVGTVFDIVQDAGGTRVAVSEGAVDWKQHETSVRVPAGRSLRMASGSSSVEMGSVSPDMVGGFSKGQLSFDGASLAEASADLARTIGTAVTADAAIAARPVRGTVRLDGSAADVVQRFASLLGLRAARDGETWRLTASP